MPRIVSAEEAEAFRARLIAAAEQLIVSRGSLDFTMRDLAAALNCSQMLPYRYFEDKNDIVAAVRASAFTRFAEALGPSRERPGPALQRSQGVGDAYVAFALSNPMLYRLMFASPAAEPGRYPELEVAGARARATMTDHVREAIADGRLAGDPVVIGHVFWASLHGLIMLQLSGQLAAGPAFEVLREATIKALIHGLRKKSPSPAGA
ncbi:TetR/AcrR family transcriptional regulator [Roseomonas gilardii]|uniref:TetR/AcrR family transcriptional regulator n=1 Tax=Roseomonas gilardii TaxID=257708 RepID=UPI00119EDD94|nr:TetR/AcrR family transcriptional regulator [Roseomonas gilardii]